MTGGPVKVDCTTDGGRFVLPIQGDFHGNGGVPATAVVIHPCVAISLLIRLQTALGMSDGDYNPPVEQEVIHLSAMT